MSICSPAETLLNMTLKSPGLDLGHLHRNRVCWKCMQVCVCLWVCDSSHMEHSWPANSEPPCCNRWMLGLIAVNVEEDGLCCHVTGAAIRGVNSHYSQHGFQALSVRQPKQLPVKNCHPPYRIAVEQSQQGIDTRKISVMLARGN